MLQTYQEASRATAIYPNQGDNWTYPALGLAGEVGEICNKLKKVMRDDGGVLSDSVRATLADELGDVLWYVAQLATELKLDLNDVAAQNLVKLASRQQRGTIGGNGDQR
jgi:NTP pyrophosphatase (non-canonical NTP hydrolase)